MSNYWNYVFNYIKQVDHVYFAIGCAMPQYRFSDESNSNYMFDITERNNQQYPCFMNKYKGKKMIILVDPHLEFTTNTNNTSDERELVIQQYFKRIGQSLETIVNSKTIRVLENAEIIVIATMDSFNYEETEHMTNKEINYFRENFTTFNNMIELCIETRKKLIVQDYTGRDLTRVYLQFLDMYGNQILNNIIFDVTQNNGGCFIELKPTHATIDKNGRFVQEKYLKLVDCVNSEMFNDVYKKRLSSFNYPLSWCLFKMKEDETYSEFNLENYKLYFIIYECKYDPRFKQESLSILLKKMLDDMLLSRGVDISLGDSIISKISNRTEFNKEVRSILEF